MQCSACPVACACPLHHHLPTPSRKRQMVEKCRLAFGSDMFFFWFCVRAGREKIGREGGEKGPADGGMRLWVPFFPPSLAPAGRQVPFCDALEGSVGVHAACGCDNANGKGHKEEQDRSAEDGAPVLSRFIAFPPPSSPSHTPKRKSPRLFSDPPIRALSLPRNLACLLFCDVICCCCPALRRAFSSDSI